MIRALLLCAAAAVATAQYPATTNPNTKADGNLWAERIRQHVLAKPDFSKIIPPTSNRSDTLGAARQNVLTDTGTDVFLQIRFFKVQAIKAAEGVMQLKIWFRMKWKDLRLAWDPSEFGNVTQTWYQGTGFGGAEENEVWVPDVQPYNSINGIVNTLEPSLVRVDFDGSVYYSRPGQLEVMCKFTGLVAFPFDQLACKMEVGGWILDGWNQGIDIFCTSDGTQCGYEFSKQEDTSGSSYQEYLIQEVEVTTDNYAYEASAGAPWPLVKYNLRLTRSSFFYEWVSLVPGIVITILSFAVFFSDTASADPLGYGISVIVVNLLGNLVLIELLPVCGELIWIDLFSINNTGFCTLALAQSAFNIMLENHDKDTLLPEWMIVLCSAFGSWVRHFLWGIDKRAERGDSEILASADAIRESVAGVIYRASAPEGGETEEEDGPSDGSSCRSRGPSVPDSVSQGRTPGAPKLSRAASRLRFERKLSTKFGRVSTRAQDASPEDCESGSHDGERGAWMADRL